MYFMYFCNVRRDISTLWDFVFHDFYNYFSSVDIKTFFSTYLMTHLFLLFCDLPNFGNHDGPTSQEFCTWLFGHVQRPFVILRLHFLFYSVLFSHMIISAPLNVSTPATSFPAPLAEDQHGAAVPPDLLVEIRPNTTSVTRVTTCM